jgi:uncharacterized protein (TIGR03435 family)
MDHTGLAGSFDFQLTWTLDTSLSAADGDKATAGGIAPDRAGGSFFTAVQEQLGLKLESTKGPVETIIIDHVERPSEN